MLFDPVIIHYLLFLLIALLLNRYDDKGSLLLPILMAFIFSILATNRSLAIPDTKEYIHIYELINSDLFDFQERREEKGFLILIKIFKALGFSVNWFFFCISIINSLILIKALRNLKIDIVIGLAFYMSFYGLYYNFIILRFGLAFSLFILAISYQFRGCNFKSTLFLLLATIFHYIAFLGFLSLFAKLAKPIFSRKVLILIVVLSFLLEILGMSNFIIKPIVNALNNRDSGLYVYYMVSAEYISGFSLRNLVMYLAAIVGLVFFYNELKPYYNILVLCVFGVFLQSILSSFMWGERLSIIFSSLIFVVVSILFSRGEKQGVGSILIAFLLLLTNVVFFYRMATFNFIL